MDILKMLIKRTLTIISGIKNNIELIKLFEEFWNEIRNVIDIRNDNSTELTDNDIAW